MEQRTFTITEKQGNLVYVVMWIGLHKLPSIVTFETLEEATKQFNHLKRIGREPSIMVDISEQVK